MTGGIHRIFLWGNQNYYPQNIFLIVEVSLFNLCFWIA
jgi:hypothetical protein